MKKTIYMIFVIIKYLDRYSVVKDRLMGQACIEFLETFEEDENGISLLLFAVTDKKKYVEDFFIFHKKEIFIVRKYSLEKALNVYKEFFGDSYRSSTELCDLFTPCWLMSEQIGISFWKNDKLNFMKTPIVITEDEVDVMWQVAEALDELLYSIYDNKDFINFLYDKVFSEEMKKSLEKISFRKLQYAITGLRETTNDNSFRLNEYGCLLELYGDILIGGNNNDDLHL